MAEKEALTVWEELAFWLLGLECGILALEEVEAELDRHMAEDPDPPLAYVDAAWSVTKGWLPFTHTLSEALRNRDWSRERVRQALLARIRAGVRGRRGQDFRTWQEAADGLVELGKRIDREAPVGNLELALHQAQELAEMGYGDDQELQALVRRTLYLSDEAQPPADSASRKSGEPGRNLVLIGMMGCGKTTVGGLLARRLDRELVDTDAYIEAQAGRSIPELFAAEGEAGFRARERSAAEELSRRRGLVIACGGGLPTQPEAMAPLKESGLVFWLRRDPGETYDTVSMAGRPLGQGGRAAFVERYRQREPIYRQWSDHFIAEPTPEAAAARIATIFLEEVAP